MQESNFCFGFFVTLYCEMLEPTLYLGSRSVDETPNDSRQTAGPNSVVGSLSWHRGPWQQTWAVFLAVGGRKRRLFFLHFFFLGERLIQMSQCQFSPQRQSLLSLYVGGNVWEWGGRGLSLEEIDVACDVHTWQEDDPSFEVGVTRVLPVYPRTNQLTSKVSCQLPVSLRPTYLFS